VGEERLTKKKKKRTQKAGGMHTYNGCLSKVRVPRARRIEMWRGRTQKDKVHSTRKNLRSYLCGKGGNHRSKSRLETRRVTTGKRQVERQTGQVPVPKSFPESQAGTE